MRNTHRRRHAALAISLALLMPASCEWAQAAEDDTTTTDSSKPSKPASDKQLQTVVVTGTRTTGRTEADSISPIQVISPQEMQATGYTDVSSALNALLPSLNFPHQAGDNNIAMRPITLRGMSPDDTLVLVDGVRYHTTGIVNYNNDIGRGSTGTDLNSIPMAAIDHIEVLTDGAAAQYGSDAIAGVINIILKHGAKAGENSITVGGGIQNTGGAATNGTSGSVGFNIGGADKGWVRLSWNYQSQMRGSNKAGFGNQTPADEAANGGYLFEYVGEPATKTYQGALNFGYNVSDNVQAYGSVIASRRDGTGNSYFRTPGGHRDDTDLYPGGYIVDMTAHLNDFQGTLGIKGKTSNNWNWNLYGTYGVSDSNIDTTHGDNISYWKAFGYSPSSFYEGSFTNSNAQINYDMSRDFHFGFLPNPVTVAFGVQARRESYTVSPGEPASYFGYTDLKTNTTYPVGSQDYAGITPEASGNWQRYSEAAYFDIESDLTDKLSAGLAGRFENYDQGIGNTFSGKASMRYQFTDTFALRGTVSNGFRAPSLAQEHYESVTTSVVNRNLTQQGTYPVSSAPAQALGAQPLKPEKSANYSFGAVWQPTDSFSATFDIYQIRIWDEILYSDAIALGNDPVTGQPTRLTQYFNSRVPGLGVTDAQFFTNAATSRVRGAELVANYRLDLNNWGRLDFSADANFNQTKVLSVDSSNPILNEYGDGGPGSKLFGPGSIGLLEKSSPETKFVLGANWHIANWGIMLNETRYGAVTRYPAEDPYPPGVLPQTYAARWITNLALSYNLKDWTFSIAANNLFNQYPTRISASNDQYFYNAIPYDSGISPFGISGGSYYASATFRF